MAKTTQREAIGSAIAYDIDWLKYGFPTVMRAGGTIWLRKQGKVFRIAVEEISLTAEGLSQEKALRDRKEANNAMPEEAE